MFIFPVQLTTSRIGNLTRLIHSLLYVMTIHTYIHTYCMYRKTKTIYSRKIGTHRETNLGQHHITRRRSFRLPVVVWSWSWTETSQRHVALGLGALRSGSCPGTIPTPPCSIHTCARYANTEHYTVVEFRMYDTLRNEGNDTDTDTDTQNTHARPDQTRPGKTRTRKQRTPSCGDSNGHGPRISNQARVIGASARHRILVFRNKSIQQTKHNPTFQGTSPRFVFLFNIKPFDLCLFCLVKKLPGKQY